MVRQAIEWIQAIVITSLILLGLFGIASIGDEIEERWQLEHDPCKSSIGFENPCN